MRHHPNDRRGFTLIELLIVVDAALKGNGGKARLVMLPGEAHGYRARESVGHTLREMVDWMDRYVKNPGRPLTP